MVKPRNIVPSGTIIVGEVTQVNRFGMRLVMYALFVALLAGIALPVSAHQTKEVGGEYLVSVGFLREPIYTGERDGLDLIVRRAADREPVEHLEGTIFAEIIAPDGVTRREMPVRAQHGQPGRYTADILLTVPGHYKLRIWGFIHDVEFDEVFELHEVLDIATLRFPN